MPMFNKNPTNKANRLDITQWTKNNIRLITGVVCCSFVLVIILVVLNSITLSEMSDILTQANKNINDNNTEKKTPDICASREKKPLFEDLFKDGFQAGFYPGALWQPLSQDGKVITTKDDKNVKGIVVKSTPFKTYHVPEHGKTYLDHRKWFHYTTQQFLLEQKTEVVGEVEITATIFNTSDNPFAIRNRADPRLAAVVFSSIDKMTDLQNDFVITNKKIYASITRNPDKRIDLKTEYACYRYLVPLKTRKSASTKHKLAIAYNRSAGTVRWIIDDDEYFRVNRLGMRAISRQYMTMDLGGKEQWVHPTSVQFGFGTASYLDQFSTCESYDEKDVENSQCIYEDDIFPTYLQISISYCEVRTTEICKNKLTASQSPVQGNLNFGQGAQLNINYIHVYSLMYKK